MIKVPGIWGGIRKASAIDRLVTKGAIDPGFGLDFFGWQSAANYFNSLDGGNRDYRRYWEWKYEDPMPTNIAELDPEVQWEVREVLRLNGYEPKWDASVNEEDLWE